VQNELEESRCQLEQVKADSRELIIHLRLVRSSVGDPDPHVFGPSGSRSISQRYGSGSGSGSYPFLINVLSGRKLGLKNKIFSHNCSKN
jgi:hypothetical protein